MPTVTSPDGTSIASETQGEGPPVILVDGALGCRALGVQRKLAGLLADRFRVVTYDRRGRGQSGDTPPYAIEREIDDVEALVAAAGGSTCLYGISSGAALALEAATRLTGVARLALYEAPFIVDATRTPITDDYLATLESLVARGRRGAAVKHFLRAGVQLPAPMVALMPLMPAWRKLKAVAHTLPYDARIVAGHQRGEPLPAGRWDAVTAPTLVADGAKSPEWMRNANAALAAAVPGAVHRRLSGQTHMVKAPALAPVLAEFFAGGNGASVGEARPRPQAAA